MTSAPSQPPTTVPRLGFVGLGWIGRDRMNAIAASGAGEVVAVADVDAKAAASAATAAGGEVLPVDTVLDGDLGLDGVVIATPSALHADQAVRALQNGLAVFCQKPLGRTAEECAAVVDAAQQADRLLAVDLSYRYLAAVTRLRQCLEAGLIGEIYAADLVFHNAYGPDKAWFTDPALAGGGCVIDLGIHLVDLAMWLLDEPKVDAVTSRLYARGRPLTADPAVVEDYAVARLDLSTGAVLNLSCSWFLHAGQDAVIAATFHGTSGSLAVHNVDGSFYDFSAVHRTGTTSRFLVEPPDEWGGRAAVRWAQQLGAGQGHDAAAARELVDVAAVLDRIYGR